MPLQLTVSCFSKIQIAFTFLVPAHPGSPGKRAVKRVCVCVCLYASVIMCFTINGRYMIMFVLCRCRSAWSTRLHWSDRSIRNTRTCWTQGSARSSWILGRNWPRWIRWTAWRYGLSRLPRLSRYTLHVSYL